jgi:hypothetical protein
MIIIFFNLTNILYEPDEDRNYRALILEGRKQQKLADPDLLKLIADQLQAILK